MRVMDLVPDHGTFQPLAVDVEADGQPGSRTVVRIRASTSCDILMQSRRGMAIRTAAVQAAPRPRAGSFLTQARMRGDMVDPRKLSFGSTAAIIISMGLIVGLDATTASTGALLGSILIAGLADNLTDSLSVHIYQESEKLPEREAFRTTTINFIARFSVSLTFLLILVALPRLTAVRLSVIWGFFLLSALSYLLARARAVSALSEIWKHGVVAVVVILMSRAIGTWILRVTGSA